MLEKRERLQAELKKYKEKLEQMNRNWAETRGGSRYGDEYLEIQIKAYQQMVAELEVEIRACK